MKKSLINWSVLIIVSLIMASNYFFYDVMGPLKSLLHKVLGFSNTEYGFLMSIYSIPNLFMPIVGGIILDRFGIKRTGIIFIFLMMLGTALTYYGTTEVFNNGGYLYDFFNSFLVNHSPAFKVMSAGFLLFGLGAETSIVVITKIIVKWFTGKELALALGLNISIARMGTVAALFFSREVAINYTWNKPIYLGFILLLISFIIFIMYSLIENKFKKNVSSNIDEEEFKLSDIKKIIKIPAFIYITLLCVSFYSCVFPFLKYAPDFLENQYNIDGVLSGKITSILPFGTIIFTPLFGFFTDLKGKSASIMFLGSFLVLLVYILFLFHIVHPFVPMFFLGIAFSLVPAAMWPSVAKIVDQRSLGTAYGIMFSIQNGGLFLFTFLI